MDTKAVCKSILVVGLAVVLCNLQVDLADAAGPELPIQVTAYRFTPNPVWAGSSGPPITSPGPMVRNSQVSSIEADWGRGPVLGTNLSDGVLIHFRSMLKPTLQGQYAFCSVSDDGFILEMDGVRVLNDWYDRDSAWINCSTKKNTSVGVVDFGANQSRLMDVWYYENMGGANVGLRYLKGSSWLPVPDSWYSSLQPNTDNSSSPSSTSSTTTTTWPTSTVPASSSTSTVPASSSTSTVPAVTPVTTPSNAAVVGLIGNSPATQPRTTLTTIPPTSLGRSSSSPSKTTVPSRPSPLTTYDSRGTKTGSIVGNSSGGLTTYDSRGTKTGSIKGNSSGGLTTYDSRGTKTGTVRLGRSG